MSSAMRAQSEAGGVGADADSLYDGRPEGAIADARGALGAADAAATNLYAAFETTKSTLSRIPYAGPDFADEDD